MRHIAKLLACGSILAAAAPAIAQAHDVSGYGQRGDIAGGDWNNGGATYDQFTQEYDHIAQMIRHSTRDGTLNQRQIAGSWNELRYIRALAYHQQRSGHYNPQIIQARLTRLHDGLHLRHDGAHRAQDRDYGNDSGQYGRGYNARSGDDGRHHGQGETYGRDAGQYGFGRGDDGSRGLDGGRYNDQGHGDNNSPY